ncbi:MAG: FCD domain-containing protein [Cypionkella sp.]
MTLAEKAYDAMRHDIIRGELAPGKPLRLADLKARYAMGFSPLREALNRLQAERLVISEALRGFRVAALSLAELQDAVASRIIIETQALRAAIRHGGDDWETGIVAALYTLNQQASRKSVDIWELEARHHAFHRALLVACGSPWMLEFFERLYAATERYRIPILLEAAEPSGRDIQAEHAGLAEAAVARDADLAVHRLQTHYGLTAEAIAQRMQAAVGQDKPARRMVPAG